MKHGLSSHPLYKTYVNMMSRCYNENDKKFKYYGGSGVVVCDEWKNSFTAFYNWAIINGWEKGLQLDKDILCNKNNIEPKIYSPETCLFVTKEENNEHRFKNTATAINIAKFYGVSRETVRNYRDGSIEKQRLYQAMVKYFIEVHNETNRQRT